MKEFFENLKKVAQISKDRISEELRRSEKESFEKSQITEKPVIFRTKLSKNKEEAKEFDLSTSDGIKKTEEEYRNKRRLERCLTLSDNPTR